MIGDRLYGEPCNVAQVYGTKDSQGVAIYFPLTPEDMRFLTGAHRISITGSMKLLKNACNYFD